jgi:uncharacterized integral membrane protein
MKFLGTIVSILVVIATTGAGVLFALQNKTPVPLDMLFHSFEPRSVALWVLGAFAVGGLLGVVMSSGMILRKRAALAASNRQLQRVREELDQLRSTGMRAGE